MLVRVMTSATFTAIGSPRRASMRPCSRSIDGCPQIPQVCNGEGCAQQASPPPSVPTGYSTNVLHSAGVAVVSAPVNVASFVMTDPVDTPLLTRTVRVTDPFSSSGTLPMFQVTVRLLEL